MNLHPPKVEKDGAVLHALDLEVSIFAPVVRKMNVSLDSGAFEYWL